MKHSKTSAGSATAVGSSGPIVRCAIYTRTSTDENLSQSFNSLDAQHEACAAFVKSQAGQGWILDTKRYDDGGCSGGTMNRPALREILEDVAHGRVDVVVVYKIDRLTRSLADFAKIVEQLELRQASFVSVTQAFSTTTSVGRLTLNILLSFAQFERELGAERVRDKVAASKRKGMWMGGMPPLGYDISDRRLVINPDEAEAIRWIFTRYLEVSSIPRLKAEIERAGIATKCYVSQNGRRFGGHLRWYVGPLRDLLRNRIYAGQVRHKGNIWPGEHAAIITVSLFEAVQAQLTANRPASRKFPIQRRPALLTGLVFDDLGNPMSPQATTKRGASRTYSYYVSQAVLQRRSERPSCSRLPASALDETICRVIRSILRSADRHHAYQMQDRLWGQVGADLAGLNASPPIRPETLVRTHVHRIVISRNELLIDLVALPTAIPITWIKQALLELSPDATADRREDGGLGLRLGLAPSGGALLLDSDPSSPGGPGTKRFYDRALIQALVLGHRLRRALEVSGSSALDVAAANCGYQRSTARKFLRLAFLAPELQQSILAGTQPKSLNVRRILRQALPWSWRAQYVALGIQATESPAHSYQQARTIDGTDTHDDER